MNYIIFILLNRKLQLISGTLSNFMFVEMLFYKYIPLKCA